MDILDRVAPSSLFGGQEDLSLLLNQVFYAGLAVAVVLAVVMIVRGGVQYMTIDAATSKDSGKKRIQAALGGLVLAFSAVLILSTVNPNIVKLNLSFKELELDKISEIEVDALIINSVNNYAGITQEQYAEYLRTGKIPDGLSNASQKILAEALNSVGNLKTGAIPGTDSGNKACAAAVNMIIQRATGQPINSSLSTIDMYNTLSSSGRFTLVGSSYANAMPGDIIISPTSGGKTGHVGIVAERGATSIISNSSSKREVRANHSASSWSNYYQGTQGLNVYIFRPN